MPAVRIESVLSFALRFRKRLIFNYISVLYPILYFFILSLESGSR